MIAITIQIVTRQKTSKSAINKEFQERLLMPTNEFN